MIENNKRYQYSSDILLQEKSDSSKPHTSGPKTQFIEDFKAYTSKNESKFKEIKVLSKPINYTYKKKNEQWLLLAKFYGSNAKDVLKVLSSNVKYDGNNIEFHSCYLPGDMFIFIVIPESIKENALPVQEVAGLTLIEFIGLVAISAITIYSEIDKKKQNTFYYVSDKAGKTVTSNYQKPEYAVLHYAYTKRIREGEKHTIFVDDSNKKALDDTIYLYKYNGICTRLIKSGTLESLCKAYSIKIKEIDTSKSKERKDVFNKALALLKSKLPNNIKSKGKFYNSSNDKESYDDYINAITNRTALFYASLWDIDNEARTHEYEGANNSTIWEPLDKCIKSVSDELPNGYRVTSDGDWDDILLDIEAYGDKAVKESVVQETKRSDLPESEFGLPDKRKYPLNDAKHVRSAVKFFNYVSEDDEAELARNIKRKAKEYGIIIRCGKGNRLSKYINKEYVKEVFDCNESMYAVINGNIKQHMSQGDHIISFTDQYPFTKKEKKKKKKETDE